MMIISFFFLMVGVLLQDRGFVAGQTFLNLDRARTTTTPLPYAGCQQADIDSCVKADLNLFILMTSTSIQLPDGSRLQLSHREDNHVCYKSDKAEAVFTWQGSHVAGNVHVGAESWSLEGCGEKCYLWIKQSSNWQDEVSSSYMDRNVTKPRTPANYAMLRNKGERDTSTIVDISVMIWYTSQFRNTFQTEEDMETFVDLVFAQTNQGYINSEIPVRLVRYQVKQHPTMNDIGNAYQMLEDFESSMPLADLHNCADAAVLLVEQFGSSHTCGIGNVGATLDCRTLSITKKSCATGYYSFGHELGLNFGCLHNPEVGNEGNTGHFGHSDDGHAHLIKPDDSGYRTILAFRAEGHYKRVNYYSNPKVLLPQTKSPTGVSYMSNNARIITANRFAIAECGNEKLNGNCNGGTTTSSSDTKESSTKSSVSKIELRGGSVPTEGNVFLNGQPVCDDMWDQKDARVACRMLGYSSGAPTNTSQFGQVPSKFILDDVMCEGTETSLFDCGYSSVDNCEGSEGAGVICRGSSTNAQIELRGGSSKSEGNVFLNGQPVCDDMWDKSDAKVACHMLGYSSGSPTTKSKFGSVSSKFILDDVMCSGTETSLFDCGYNEKDNCEGTEAAGVICSGSKQPKRTTPAYSSTKIELRGGSRRSEGNVFVNDQPVCDDMWDKNDASVACRMLGYSSGVATTKSKFGSVPAHFILDDVMCKGTEASLFDCGYQAISNCVGNEGAGVICSGSKQPKRTTPAYSSTKIELRGGTHRSEGNVFVNGQPVCDDMWDKNDASVACRMLGYSSGVATTKSKFGSVPAHFILDDVMCKGTETSLFDCGHQAISNCVGNEGAGVICSENKEHDHNDKHDQDHKIELRGGSSPKEGNVFVNGKPVCDDMWDKNDATVACRMLGYSSGEPSTGSKFGRVPTDFIADDMMCDGTEKSLFDCKHKRHDNCGASEGAGVICKGSSNSSPPQRYELAPPRSRQQVTCGEKNNQQHRNHHHQNNHKDQCVFPFKLFGVEYSECLPYGGKYWCALNYDFNIHSGNWGYCDQAVCPPTGIDQHKKNTHSVTLKRIELRGGSRRSEGNVIVNGKPVCDDMWDKNDATVACRMLGYDSGVPTTKSKFGQVGSEYILDDVMCDGTEASLLDCGYSAKDNCNAGEGAGVICKGRARTTPPSPVQTKGPEHEHDDKHDHDLAKIELRGGSSPTEGNVFVNGKPVCDDMWDKNDATVACRMLGYSSGEPSIRSKFGKVATNFILDDVMCDGTEKSLFDCGHRSHSNCGGAEGAGVICTGKTYNSPSFSSGQGSSKVELRGGNSQSEGNIFINGQPICDDIWGSNDATVACRMLGFPYGGIATTKSAYGNVTPNYLMTDVKCTGREDNLFNCRYTLDNDCTGAEAAGVKCRESSYQQFTTPEMAP